MHATSQDIRQRCLKEIVEFHDFLEIWFNGRVEQTEENFDRVRKTLTAGFTMVLPNGVFKSADGVVARLWEENNTRANQRISIEDVTVCHRIGDFVVATYLEGQDDATTSTLRRSTVVFRMDATRINGLEWCHLHEVWVAGRAPQTTWPSVEGLSQRTTG